MVVRVVVAADLLSRPRPWPQPPGHGRRAVLAHVRCRRAQRPAGGVGLRRQRQIYRRLGERELASGMPTCSTACGRRDRHRERARVGVADVLGGEHHHPADDEPRVLAALEHHRQVVQRRVRVRAARRLDPGRDRVVVAVARAVVQQRPALERILRPLDPHAGLAQLPRGLQRQLQRVQRRARVAALRAARNSSASASTSTGPRRPRTARRSTARPPRRTAPPARTRACARAAPR